MELRKKVVGGLRWSSGASLINQILNAITKIIVARLLFPSDFGVFAMALILINFLSLFTGFGFMSALIYKKENEEKTFSTAFILSFFFGIILFGISFFSSSFIASFFNHSELKLMIMVLSICFIFDSLSYIISGSLLKNLAFKKKAIVDIVSSCLYAIFVIMFAYFDFGVWSLIWGYIIQRFIVIILLVIVSPQKPRFVFDKNIAKEIMHFGKYVAATSLFAWFILTIDNIAVGKIFGAESLGYYSFAFTIASLPVVSITHIFNTVFHPVYASLQDDKERLKKAYLKALEMSLFLIFPVTIGLFVIAPQIVSVVLGEKWLAIIPLLRIFAVYCIFRSVCTIIAQLLEGIGKPKRAGFVAGVELLIIVCLLIPSLKYGLNGVAFAVVLARFISMCLYLVEIRKVIDVSIQDYIPLLWKKILCVSIMGLFVYLLSIIFVENTILNLSILITCGAVSSISMLLCIDRDLLQEIKMLVSLR